MPPLNIQNKNNKKTIYLLELVAVQIYFFLYPIISELMTWNLHELVVFQIIFVLNTMICIYIYIILWKLYEFGRIFRLFLYLKNSEQITRTLYDLVAFAFDSYTLEYYGIYNHRTTWHKICMIWLHFQNDFCILNYHDMNICINFRTNDVKFAWIGCMFKMICVSLTIMIYIYIHT